MRPVFLALVGLLFSGCKAVDVQGVWTGDCTIAAMTMESSMAMTLDLGALDGDTVEGVGTIADAEFGEAPVEIVGTVDKRDVKLEIVYVLPEQPTTTNETGTSFEDLIPTLEIEATVKGDEMEGTCSISVFGFAIGSDIVLVREQ